MNTKKRGNESFKSLEPRFEATVCSYNSACPNDSLPEALVSYTLLGGAKVGDAQRVSILSAAAPKSDGERI